MDALRAKMQEFLKMETEISYEEFNEYYKSVMDFLQREFENLDQDGLVTMSGICQIMYLNAGSRGQRKSEANQKKFRKMAEKGKFWYDAMELRLNKQYGLKGEALEEAIDALWEE